MVIEAEDNNQELVVQSCPFREAVLNTPVISAEFLYEVHSRNYALQDNSACSGRIPF